VRLIVAYDKYIPPLMKKVVDECFIVHDMYPKIEFEIWLLISKVIAWVARLLNQPDTFIVPFLQNLMHNKKIDFYHSSKKLNI